MEYTTQYRNGLNSYYNMDKRRFINPESRVGVDSGCKTLGGNIRSQGGFWLKPLEKILVEGKTG